MIKTFMIAVLTTIALTSTSFAVEADVNKDGCVTQEEAITALTTNDTAVTVVEQNDAGVRFSHPDRDTDLVVLFDDKGCAATTMEIPD